MEWSCARVVLLSRRETDLLHWHPLKLLAVCHALPDHRCGARGLANYARQDACVWQLRDRTDLCATACRVFDVFLWQSELVDLLRLHSSDGCGSHRYLGF